MKTTTKTWIGLLALIPLTAALVACSPLTAINTLSPGGASRVTLNLPYGSDQRNKLDVYTPLAANGAAPVVVFFYGGNWTSGDRADYAFVGRSLASRGIVTVVADYRLYPAVHYPEILDDTAQAVAWAIKQVAQYGGDPHRLFVMGHSAGGYNAAMVALDGKLLAKYGMTPDALRGWIGLAGPYDFLPIENPTAKPVFFAPNTPPDSQPINHVTRSAPPALLIAAKHDNLVDPLRNTGGLASKLRANGVPVSVFYFDRGSHPTLVASIAAPLRWLAPTLDTVVDFVDSDGGRLPVPPARP